MAPSGWGVLIVRIESSGSGEGQGPLGVEGEGRVPIDLNAVTALVSIQPVVGNRLTQRCIDGNIQQHRSH